MTDVLLVVPPSPQPMTVLYPYSTRMQPLGVAYIASVLRNNGISVKIFDFWPKQITEAYFSHILSVEKPQIVGFSTMTDNFLNGVRLARVCKRANPNTFTVFGGPHVTFTDTETLSSYPDIDVVVRNEGEYTMLELCRQLLSSTVSLGQVRGITYRDGNVVQRNPPRPLIQNLDAIPFPARDLIGPLPHAPGIQTSRGCPNQCTFCVAGAMSGGRYRYRTAENVVEEIIQVNRMGANHVLFQDDTLTGNLNRLYEICNLLRKTDTRITWSAESRADIVRHDQGIFEFLAHHGCVALQFGVESGSQDTLDAIKKNVTVSEIMKSVQLARKAGIRVYCSMMVGLPHDTRESVAESVRFAEFLAKEYGAIVVLAITVPYPGTYIARNAESLGVRIHQASYNHYHVLNALMDTRYLSRKEIRRLHFDTLWGLGKLIPQEFKDAIRLRDLSEVDVCIA